MENSGTMQPQETVQTSEMEQQVNHQKEINDKLLHKYVIARTKYISSNSMAKIVLVILIIVLGIIAKVAFNLDWPAIVAVCLSLTAAVIYDLIISLPLSKGNLEVASSQDFQGILLKHKKYDIIGTAVYLPLMTAAVVWFAFELRDSFVLRHEGAENFIFWAVIVYSLMVVVAVIVDTSNKSKDIDSIVEDIKELKI